MVRVGGWWLALAYVVAGVLLCLSVLGIPFGIACFKLVPLALVPSGKEISPADSLPPWQVYEVAATKAIGLGGEETAGATRWRF